jgi:radical SAM protein with 4Fe4S-binding SPASM domain
MTVKPRLQSIIFEVTQRCNHACLHCYNVWHGNDAYPRGELDTRRTIDLLDKALAETSCNHVTLTGGEPLLRADLHEILDHLRKLLVHTTIISNGRLIDPVKAKEVMECGVGLFELPLLSHRAEIHDELSGLAGAWEAVLEAMTNIRLQRGQVVCAYVATRNNIKDVYETFRLAFAFGARAIMFNRFNPGGRGWEHLEELLPSAEQVRQALAAADAAAQEFNLPVSCSIPIQPCLIDTGRFPHIQFSYCSAGSAQAYYTLDPLGNVRPCNHTDIILGNLFQTPFPDLIRSARMASFERAFPPACSPCSRRYECLGGCKASAQVCYGSLTEAEPFLRRNPAIVTPT